MFFSKYTIFYTKLVLSIFYCSHPPGKHAKWNSHACFFTRGIFHESPCLLQAWWNKVVTDWIWQACYSIVPTNLLQVSWQACYKLDANKLATASSRQNCYKSVDKLLQVCHNKLGTTSASTSCEQVVGADLLQVCCRFVTSCAFLRVYWS
jgi:hypothetical protein